MQVLSAVIEPLQVTNRRAPTPSTRKPQFWMKDCQRRTYQKEILRIRAILQTLYSGESRALWHVKKFNIATFVESWTAARTRRIGSSGRLSVPFTTCVQSTICAPSEMILPAIWP
jgi:hypothetical protein